MEEIMTIEIKWANIGLILLAAWLWVLVYYWIDSPLPGWIVEGLK
jgi:hypothetical protein